MKKPLFLIVFIITACMLDTASAQAGRTLFPQLSKGSVVACAFNGKKNIPGTLKGALLKPLDKQVNRLRLQLKRGNSRVRAKLAVLERRLKAESRVCKKGRPPILGKYAGMGRCAAVDIVKDDEINFQDLKRFASVLKIKNKKKKKRFDLTGDKKFNRADLEVVLGCWGSLNEGKVPAGSNPSCAWSPASAVFNCGNGVCNSQEDCASCPSDCGDCGPASLLHQDNFNDGNYESADPQLENGLSWELVEGTVKVTDKLNGPSLTLLQQNITILAAPEIISQETTIEARAGAVWSHAARIVFLYKDSANYYFFGLSGNKRGLYRVMDGAETLLTDLVYTGWLSLAHARLSEAPLKVYYRHYGSFIKFKLDISGFENGIDFEETVEDNDPKAAARFQRGRVGFQTVNSQSNNYAGAYIDDVAIYSGHKAAQRVRAIGSYYVDGQRGDDANPGSEAAPWKTIAKAASHLMAGDTVLIGPGIYREGGIVPKFSGTRGAPITYKALDPANPPVLEGTSTGGELSWQVHSGPIYSALVSHAPLSIYQHNTPLFIAQEPKQPDADDQMKTEYFMSVPEAENDENLPESHWQLTDSSFLTQPGSDFWKGARLLLYDSYINAIDSERDVLHYDAARHRIIMPYGKWVAIGGAKDKYALRNHLSLLTRAGEYVIEKGLLNVVSWTENGDKTLDATVTVASAPGHVTKVRFVLLNAATGTEITADSDLVSGQTQTIKIQLGDSIANVEAVYAIVQETDKYRLYVWPYAGGSVEDLILSRFEGAFELTHTFAEYLVFDGLEVRYYEGSAFNFSSAASVRNGVVRNCNVHRNGGGVSARTNAEGLLVEYSKLHHNYGNGVSFGGGRDYYVEHNEINNNLDNGVWSGNGQVEQFYVRDVHICSNYIHHQGSHRTHPDNIQLYKTDNAVVDGNYLLQEGHQNTWFSKNGTIYFTNNIVINGPAGINSSPQCFVYNNLFYKSTARFDAWQEEERYMTRKAEVRNNIFIDSALTRPPEPLWPNMHIDHNFYSVSGYTRTTWINTGLGEGSIMNQDPENADTLKAFFRNPAEMDFHLADGSALIDAGDLYPPTLREFDGKRRFQGVRPDIGPYESESPYSFEDCFNGQMDPGEAGTDCGGICQQDFDGDGYPIKTCNPASPILDCDDTNTAIHPQQDELPDGIDRNCDGNLHRECYFDGDRDGIDNCRDNCPVLANPDQSDGDGDKIGDVCDTLADFRDDFESRMTGAGDLATVKQAGGLSWEAIAGSAAIQLSEGSRVLRIPDYQTGDQLAIAKEGLNSWQNYRLDLDVRKSWTSPRRGIVLHYANAQNFYYLDLAGGRLVRRSGGNDLELGKSAAVALAHGENEMHHYTFQVRTSGGGVSFEVSKDGTPGALFTDSAPGWTAGTIGLVFDDNGSPHAHVSADNVGVQVE